MQKQVVLKSNGLPSTGLSNFVDDYDTLSDDEKRARVAEICGEILAYENWEAVVHSLEQN